MKGYIITRISCYTFGNLRHDMQFDDLPEEVQSKVLDEIEKELDKGDH